VIAIDLPTNQTITRGADFTLMPRSHIHVDASHALIPRILTSASEVDDGYIQHPGTNSALVSRA